MNISPAATGDSDCECFLKPWELSNPLISIKAGTFKTALGEFAVPHIDKYDEGAALTAMALLPSIPLPGYCPGIFAYHDFKIFIAPSGPAIVYFTGLHRHGGTAPAPKFDNVAREWAYRLSVICYPNGPTVQGTSRNPIAPFAGFDVIKVSQMGTAPSTRSNTATKDNIASEDNTTSEIKHSGVLKIPPEIRNRERYLLYTF